MRHRTTQIIYGYWNEVRGDRLAPRRFDIEPARIAGILAETMILEESEPDTFRFRLAGTRITESFATELRGTNFLDLWTKPDQLCLAHRLTQLKQTGGALVVSLTAETGTGRKATFEAILMPLYHTRDVVDRFLGAISCASNPMWLGTEPFERLTLNEAEVVWPDGRPHAMSERTATTPVLAPEPAGSRIVRFQRRQFRVLDGGRAPLDQGKS